MSPVQRLTMRLDELDPDQRLAVTAPRGPLCILAGAGTGKTRTITHRIAYLIQQGFVLPDQVLALSFTSRAAGEMRERLRLMGTDGVQARTFHSAALKQLTYFWPRIAPGVQWRLLNRKFTIMGRAVRRAGLANDKNMIRDVQSEIEWAKASLISADNYEEYCAKIKRDTPAPADAVAAAYRAYEEYKVTPDGLLVDFDDVLLLIAGAMEDYPSIRQEFQDQYKSFVVDEYQDVTPLQQRVLDVWLGDRDDLTVVGDANQTIYSFTGADPSLLLNFTRRFENATLVRLNRDYRSTPQVVDLANKVIGQAKGRVAGTRLELIGQRKPGPRPSFTGYPTEAAEAAGVARRIKELIDNGVPASEIAILYRVNAASSLFEAELARHEVPFFVKEGEGFFQRREIIHALKQLRKRADYLQSKRWVPQGRQLAREVSIVISSCGLTPEPPVGESQREAWYALHALLDLCRDMHYANPDMTLPRMVDLLRERAENKMAPALNGVTLASIHSAKGAEWDCVFVVGLREGMVPIQQAVRAGSHAIEEERRLLYVAVTRAREQLYCSWPLARSDDSRSTFTRTRFLDGIVRDGATFQHSAKERSRAVCSQCGELLEDPAERILGHCSQCEVDVDPELVKRLRSWRLVRARELDVPAFTVFTDATLRAIVEAAPQSIEELLKISGIGKVKAERFGEDVVAIVKGEK